MRLLWEDGKPKRKLWLSTTITSLEHGEVHGSINNGHNQILHKKNGETVHSVFKRINQCQ